MRLFCSRWKIVRSTSAVAGFPESSGSGHLWELNSVRILLSPQDGRSESGVWSFSDWHWIFLMIFRWCFFLTKCGRTAGRCPLHNLRAVVWRLESVVDETMRRRSTSSRDRTLEVLSSGFRQAWPNWSGRQRELCLPHGMARPARSRAVASVCKGPRRWIAHLIELDFHRGIRPAGDCSWASASMIQDWLLRMHDRSDADAVLRAAILTKRVCVAWRPRNPANLRLSHRALAFQQRCGGEQRERTESIPARTIASSFVWSTMTSAR